MLSLNLVPPEGAQKTLLDDDPIPLSDEPITLIHPPNLTTHLELHKTFDSNKDIINEFDTIVNASNDPDDEEFEALAAESLSKSAKVLHSLPATNSSGPIEDVQWNAFEDKKFGNLEVDPFDTSFAENILPGKAELKIIENEIFNDDQNFKFVEEHSQVVNGVSIQITDSIIQRNIIQTENRVPESELNLIKPIHRDLLGGSNTDLSVLNNQPLHLTDGIHSSHVEYCDPFDSSVADFVKQQDISILEKDLLAEEVLSDDDFDPRREEKSRERTASRPDVLNIVGIKTVSFDVTSQKETEQLGTGEGGKIIKPLTPFYIRKKSVPELPLDEDLSDPFDTSFASNIAPGKAELKVIESELFDPIIEKELSLVDNDFDPRDEKKLKSINILIMAANPFLINEEMYHSPQSATSNPFLLEDENTSHDGSEFNENPFLSSDTIVSSAATTNPFAFDPIEPHSETENVQVNISSNDKFVNNSSEKDFFTSNGSPIFNEDKHFNSDKNLDVLVNSETVAPQKPTDLDLTYSHPGVGNGPPRPPPPRVPPSKETQDLLMSVMGAIDATSSSLLDKIPPTRTPSPVSMRDLHSPSPTPDTTFGDLLDVSDRTTETTVSNKAEDLFKLSQEEGNCDINQNPAIITTPQQIKPSRPSPPVRPPKPAPPQKPPPPGLPYVSPNNQKSTQIEDKNDPDEEPDMFGVETTPQKTSVSKADILNLYNTVPPKPEQVKTDLLFDTMESEVIVESVQESIIQEKNDDIILREDLNPEFSPVNQSSDIIRDNFLSPDPQNENQMDTSDSQSKESVSSVTFNPFAPTENFNQQISPQNQNEVFEDNSGLKITDFDHSNISTSMFDNISDLSTDDAFNISGPIDNTINDDFDAFAEKFDSVRCDENKNGSSKIISAWGNETSATNEVSTGFGTDDNFDAFLALEEPPCVPQSTPNRISKTGSQESDEDKDFSVFIRPKGNEDFVSGILPTIAPPPAPVSAAFTDTSPRFNPFDQQNEVSTMAVVENDIPYAGDLKRSDSQETPPTPLYDEDVSQPLEPFPRINFTADGWDMHLHCVLLQLFNQKEDKDPFQELPLQPCYSVSDIGAQQYDQFGKIFTIKLQYIFYKERPGVRPGQVKKAERITNKLSQFAAYAIQGDYQGVKEFGSDLKKLGLPVEHAPQVSQLMKLGSLNFEDLKQFSFSIEEALFKLTAHRDRALHYKMEEVQITAVDELYVEQDAEGHIDKQIARVRLFFLGFLTGMPDVELGINDMRRQGKEVVGRHDIIPVVTEEWIRLEEVEFHSCIQQEDYNNTHIIKFKPPDACYIELMRFRVRPPRNRELPLQLKAQICVTGYKVELRADVLVPGFASRKLGQIPCEDVMIRFPIPECWIYLFRVEKHFRYGSVKSAHRRTGKIKGIERILGTVDSLQENLIEVTSGQAKYEHQHRAIVWRCPRLPKEGQALTNYDQMPEKLAEYCYVEFTMPATQVSHTTCRSVSLQNSDSDEPPEKYVRYLARHEYRVGIEHTEGESPNPYAAATFVSKPEPVVEEKPPTVAEESSSDSD
ncbi:hypothetical protein NQ314_013619 [Rhamnusium bicolor]|uniref:Protein stoned-B-like n=1 Tax=Rhamnusium bicolor TaxID=1586634 RepID=A0AAV8X639_9CUCU|nr:hypothetical protein NQ314_013619 [Rhamnusium bicolor]